MFDSAIVISRNSTEEELKLRFNKFIKGETRFFVMEGVDGVDAITGNYDELDFSVYPNWNIPVKDNDWWSRDITPGEIGCALSHYSIWKYIVDNQISSMLILEEDFHPIKKLKDINQSEIPESYDILYLGRNPQGEDADTFSDSVVVPGYSYNTHAYILTLSGAQKLLEYNFNNNLIPVDEFISAVSSVHPRNDVLNLYKPGLDTYALKEDAIVQLSNKKSQTMKNTEILNTTNWEEWCSKYINPLLKNREFELITDEITSGVLEFPLFTKKFCDELIQLAETDGNWTTDRHEFYPTTDMLVDNLKIQKIYNDVVNLFVVPLGVWFWKLEGKTWIDNNPDETFIIKYVPEQQSHLSIHHDNSKLTCVVKLNDDFSGGGTYFPNSKALVQPKRIGNAVLHPGQITHRHGARPVTGGVRYVAVSFIS
jgi:GR25 family glycosyltransferase involved in LPS biosynthesis